MNEPIAEKAEELGRLLGQTDEYKALDRARKRVDDERDLVELLNRLGELEESVARALQQGEQPDEATRAAYEEAFGQLQGHVAYQGLVAAQANFDRLMGRVNEAIGKGIAAGAQSRIIFPS